MNKEHIAQEIIETCLKMNALGLNQGTSGNISARYQDGFLITPSGIPYEKLTPEQIVFINNEGEYEAGKIPSSEWHFHLSCYQSRDELNAVVHNHAVNATAVSILNHAIPAIHYMIAVTGTDHIPCIPYATFGTTELAERVREGIKHSKALLMQHHGMIAMEINLQKALWLANEVEILAKLYLKVLPIVGNIPVLSQSEIQRVLEKFKNYGLKTE
ncbi:L-fuculose-phosphate aldolase [Xenorhabdus sp. 42]|uniref:L-fuculose-phosphate aldolase n=1 Tax=Xenorhabdus szentirmaii TaxID=290112 RepID=UPI0019C42F41|nr:MULTISPECIES: L-fuculose-phosphate aldolase [unclassified Xenorhabdus]MBD2780721.1 L-fuculose-phosphate aldolase [Xenorhabdus sp. 38]MBD2794301.1 L-fuculose-phosphate aldolase [Xenorhabdus sp. CUL]MBD2806902.1 L-fuculose-phosphate aldolase [Xenorhabdus sp. ZM]MBD2822299.1 L-fuculose-phosphate aldolase [Xenorhabdus sp. 42]MBD2826378.1 L-fuculose-phosphate aldolase [Xenorhabdus sp. 5]